jgi:hypothetical protein
MTDLDELLKVVEGLRAEGFPDLPADLIRAVVAAEAATIDDRSAALRRVGEAIDAHVSAGA